MSDSSVETRSPHFVGIVRRHFSAEESSCLIATLAFALARGGEEEVGFRRDAGVSYNPRPARVAEILIGDGAERDSSVVSAGIVACSDAPTEYGDAAVRALAVLALGPLEALIASDIRGAVAVRAALGLDFARHLHQLRRARDGGYVLTLPAESAIERETMFLKELPLLTRAAHGACPRIGDLLERWSERDAARSR